MKFKYVASRPNRTQLSGMSPSEFKTMLKKRGYKITRNFFKMSSIAEYKGRLYRFRWWSIPDGFCVDKSCILSEFDRWANSVDKIILFCDWQKGIEE